MNVSRMTRRIAVSGVATAIAAGALVGASSTAANATTGSALYNCTTPLSANPLPMVATAGADLPVSSLVAGYPVDLPLPIGVSFTAPEAVVGVLKTLGATTLGANSSDFGFRLGDATVPVNGVDAAPVDLPATGNAVLNVTTATLGSFVTPRAGTYDIKMPSSFGLNVVTNSAAGTLAVTCAIADESTAAVAPMAITKQDGTFAAKGPAKAVKKGKIAKVTGTMTNPFKAATGKVIAKEGSKVLGSASLKSVSTTVSSAAIPVKGLAVGKHKITLIYKGDGWTNGQKSAPVVVKVVK